MLLEQVEIEIQGFARPPHTTGFTLNDNDNDIQSLFPRAPSPPSFPEQKHLLAIREIRNTAGGGKKWSPVSRKQIQIQTQYLLEDTDLSEAALNGRTAQIAHTCHERKEVPGAVSRRGSHTGQDQGVESIIPPAKRGKRN